MAAAKYTVAMRTGDPTAARNSGKNLRISVEASLWTDNPGPAVSAVAARLLPGRAVWSGAGPAEVTR